MFVVCVLDCLRVLLRDLLCGVRCVCFCCVVFLCVSRLLFVVYHSSRDL